MGTMETRHQFKGNAEELRKALIVEVERRYLAVPNYGDTRVAQARKRGEQDALEMLHLFLEHLDIKP
jgi:hypothetical protein